MSAEVVDGSAAVHSPWLAESVCDEHLLAELAADLGGGTPAEPQRQYSGVGQSTPQFAGMPHLGMMQSQGSLPQPLMYPMGLGLAEAQQALLAFGSAPDLNGALPNSLTSANNGSYGANGLLQHQAQQPMLMFRPAFLPAGGGPAPAKSHSPSTSSGAVQAGDEYTDLCDAQRGGTGRAVNKGALAQKRFRERQKEKMRANEAQVAELTRKLNEVELDRSRLASRARLLEQVVSLNLIHEAKLHTNREIMVREQEMLLEDLAAFLLTMSAAAQAPHTGSSPNSPEHLQGTLLPLAHMQQQQQQQTTGMLGLQHQQQMHGADGQQMQQQDVLQQLLMQQQQQQQQQMTGAAPGVHSSPLSGQVAGLMQVIRGWTVQVMLEQVFPEYIKCLQQLLPHISGAGSPDYNSGSSNASAAAAQQAVESMVLQRREMTDRLALFSHYYWAVWCYNKGELAAQGAAPPAPQLWTQVLHSLNLSKEQTNAIVAARTALLLELNRVAADWQRVLPTLALQLLQVPRAQWHTVAAVQAMVNNLAAEREAVVGFLHTLIDEVLTPLQEGQLEASSYPWCPDVWAIAGAAAAAAQAAAANAAAPAEAAGTGRGKGGRKAAAAAVKVEPGAGGQGALNEDPLAALSMGTDVLQPLMPFMTAFQLLREPITAKGAGLRLKRALLLDPFRTVVPAAAYPQPTTAEVYNMSLLDAHCGTFQQVMLWDWLKTNLPSYLSILGMQSGTSAAGSGAAPAPYMAGGPTGLKHSMSLGDRGLMA